MGEYRRVWKIYDHLSSLLVPTGQRSTVLYGKREKVTVFYVLSYRGDRSEGDKCLVIIQTTQNIDKSTNKVSWICKKDPEFNQTASTHRLSDLRSHSMKEKMVF